MKVAIVYNRVSQRVINLLGLPNREKYGLKNINRIKNALKQGGHQVMAFEGDKDLIDRLEDFMPRVMKHERPGMVFNLAYGIQGQARYTHVPGMLEMIGLPYVGSGPLAHSLALDKVVSKMIFVQHGLPTPDFAVLEDPGFEMPNLQFPLIVKPKNEAVSFGIRICQDEKELREAADNIFNEFSQAVLVERFIAGREINVGILGNSPAEALPPAELIFGEGPQIYSYEDKTRKSGREILVECPANLDAELSVKSQEIARRAFEVLGCYDCCRVDLRLDADGNFYILEVNSLPSLGEHGSYVHGAVATGLDFAGLVNRLVDVAAARYFGTPSPPEVGSPQTTSEDRLVSFLSSQRDAMERELKSWCQVRSFTDNPIGAHEAVDRVAGEIKSLGLKPAPELTDERVVWCWQTPAGLDNGTLLVLHVDVPHQDEVASQVFRREPEWLFGEGIGSSRAPIVSMLFALQALKRARRLRGLPLGVLVYADEGRDCRYSQKLIQQAAGRAKNVLVLRPGNVGDAIVTSRRGQRRYRLSFNGESLRLGKRTRKTDVLSWAFDKLQQCTKLTSHDDRVAVASIDLHTVHMPLRLPHEVLATLLVSFPDSKSGDELEKQIREILQGNVIKWKLDLVSDRPPMKERRSNSRLVKVLTNVAQQREIPLKKESSVWPSVAGLVPTSVGVVCGMGPVARELYTPEEAVDRIGLLQRTLLLADFLQQETT